MEQVKTFNGIHLKGNLATDLKEEILLINGEKIPKLSFSVRYKVLQDTQFYWVEVLGKHQVEEIKQKNLQKGDFIKLVGEKTTYLSKDGVEKEKIKLLSIHLISKNKEKEENEKDTKTEKNKPDFEI